MTKTKRDIRLDHLMIYVADKAFTLHELGPLAHLCISDFLEALIKSGKLGEEYADKSWTEVFTASGFKLEEKPTEDDVLASTLYKEYKDEENRCIDMSIAGTLTESAKEPLLKARQKYMMATKLTKEA